MAPPLARAFTADDLNSFDDEALRAFLRPGEVGVDAAVLGVALQGAEHGGLAERAAAALPPRAARALVRGRREPASAVEVRRAGIEVVDQLFWPLVYWHRPQAYEELVAGELIHPDLLAALDVDHRCVADLGAGAGRFTMAVAARADHVVAVDAVPALLRRLEAHTLAAGVRNVETLRGDFAELPLPDASVDIAVFCSSITSRSPWGGGGVIAEALRVVRRGGQVVIIRPDDPRWFLARGFAYTALPGNGYVRFPSVAAAHRLCRDFYGGDVSAWVRQHRAPEVPYAVLGASPPNDACLLRV